MTMMRQYKWYLDQKIDWLKQLRKELTEELVDEQDEQRCYYLLGQINVVDRMLFEFSADRKMKSIMRLFVLRK